MTSKKAKKRHNTGRMSDAHLAVTRRRAKEWLNDVREELYAREYNGHALTRSYWKELDTEFNRGTSSSEMVSYIIHRERVIRPKKKYFFEDLVRPPHVDHLIEDSPGHASVNRKLAVDSIRRRGFKIHGDRRVDWGSYSVVNYNIFLADSHSSPLGGAVVIGHVLAHNPTAALRAFFKQNPNHPSKGYIFARADRKRPIGTRVEDREWQRTGRDPRKRLRARRRTSNDPQSAKERKAAFYARKRERGECYRCERPATEGARMCVGHLLEEREATRKRALRQRKEKRCEASSTCSNPLRPNSTVCEEHWAGKMAALRAKRHTTRNNAECATGCGRPVAKGSRRFCSIHIDSNLENEKKPAGYRIPEYQRRKNLGLCVIQGCSSLAEDGRTRCYKHRQRD